MSRQSSSIRLQPFMFRQRNYCRDIAPLPFAFIIVVIELRIVMTIFFSFFFSNVAT